MRKHLATTTLDGHTVEIVAVLDQRLGDDLLQVIDKRHDVP